MSNESTRMWIPKNNPAVYKALVALQRASATDVDPALNELIKIRASQLNGCAYCLHMHVKDALELGMDPLRIGIVAAWHEAGDFFDDRERAVLALTEAITNIGADGVSEDVFAAARTHFDDYELGQIVASIAMINTWNRIAIAGHYPAGLDERALRSTASAGALG